MLYYTIYIKGLNNGTGYIDVGLEDDQLLKDFDQYLDIGMRAHRNYAVTDAGGSSGGKTKFAINVADIIAITVTKPK